jgi:hypothetical protein
MPNNTNPQAQAEVDGQIRPVADLMAQLYFKAKQVADVYNVRNLGANVMPVTDDVIGPGGDGRPDVTGNTALGIIYCLNDWIAYCEANNNAKLAAILAVSPNP